MSIQFKVIFFMSISLLVSACGGGEEESSPEPQLVSKAAPQAVSGNDFSANATTEVTLNGSDSSDSDGSIVSYVWKQTSGSYNVDIIDDDSSIATFTAPDVTADAQLTFELTVTDNDGGISSDSIEATILRVNKAPIVNTPEIFSVTGNNQVVLDGNSSLDNDGTITTYEWVQTSGSPSITLDNADEAISTFTAPNVDAQLSFQLTITDNDGATDSKVITVNIQSVVPPISNIAPVASVPSVINVTGDVTNTILNGSTSSDPDGTIVGFSWAQISGSPIVSLSNIYSSVPSFKTPNINAKLIFQLTVTDNAGAKSTASTTVNVQEVETQNKVPFANASNNFSVDENSLATLNGASSSDSDGTIVNYSWIQISGSPSVSIVNSTQAVASFTAPSVDADTQLIFRLTVTDNEGATSVDSTTVTIHSTSNQAPIANASNDFSADEDSVQTLDASASSDPDGTIASYSWEQVSGSQTVSITGANQAVATFTTPSVDDDIQLVFQLTVTDDKDATNTDTVTVSIINTDTNQAPVAVTDNDFSAEEITSVTLDGSSSNDADGTISSYSWTQTGGSPSVVINSPNSAIANFMAPDVTSASALIFELSVTDNDGEVATNTVTVTINPVGTPPAATGSATLSWTAPTENTDNSALTDLASYIVYYSETEGELNNSTTVDVQNNSVVIENLTTEQTYYFAVVAVNDLGVESELSNVSSKFIQ
jgi:hypothetical protein